MLNTNEVLEKFYSQSPLVYITVDSDEVGNKMDKINKKYNINIGDLIIRIFSNEIEIEKIPSFLQKEFDVEEEKAQEIFEELNKEIIIPIRERIYFLDPDPHKTTISLSREKEILENIFSQNLIFELKNHPLIREAVNTQIFRILGADGNLEFKKNLERKLLGNQEILTSAEFELEGKPAKASISNWIKHYISQKGSEMPDNMDIVDFLVNSINVKKLNLEEKNLVEKVLWVYRNLKFFPDSMPNDEGKDWQILPLKELETITKEAEQNKNTGNEKIDKIKQEIEKYPKESIERKALEDELASLKEKS